MKKLMLAIGVCFVIPGILRAQSDVDALRFSQLNLGGTARSIGAGNAFTSLGADFTTLSQNPAGLGWYHGSELSFTPAVTGVNSKTDFIGQSIQNEKYKFNMSSFGVVIANDLSKKHPNSKWKFLNVGFGANRLNNYNSTIHYTGFNENNSLVDFYQEELNAGDGTPESDIHANFPYTAALGYEAYLVNPIAPNSNYYNSVIPDGHVLQDGLIESQGSTTEYVASIASNYNDRLYFGITLGMPIVNFSSTNSYIESDATGTVPDFRSFTLVDYLSTSGYGFNGKFGAQYRISDALRIGASIHTPTLYSMTDVFNSSISAIFDTSGVASYSTPAGSYSYNFISPWSGSVGISYFFKQNGFISADYEYVNYSQMHYQFNRAASTDDITYQNTINRTIDDKYGGTSNLRIGGEYAVHSFRFRLGAVFNQSPFKSGIGVPGYSMDMTSFSGGVGVRGKNLYADLAYVHSSTNEYYQPYSLSSESVPGVGIKKNTGTLALTIGYRY